MKLSLASDEEDDGRYSGSDWDEAIKEEAEEEDALKKAKGTKRKRAAKTGAGTAKATASKGKAKQGRKLPRALLDEDLPEPPPRKPRISGKRFGAKWYLLKDGRYQYIRNDETVSGNEDKNPLWDLLGMDRQGRLVQPLDGADTTDDDRTISESDSNSIVVLSAVKTERKSTFAPANKDENDDEMQLAEEAPPGLNVRLSAFSTLPTRVKLEEPGPTPFLTVKASDSASASDSDLSPDERLKRKRARMRRNARSASGSVAQHVKTEAEVKVEPGASTSMLSGIPADASRPVTGTASTPVQVSSDSEEADPGRRRSNKGKGRGLSRPEWWDKDAVEDLPEEQLLPRPDFPCSDEVKYSTPPLFLGKDEYGNAVQVPKTINRFLRDYQREGIKFFYKCYAEKRGGILGDDMGLGKTFLAAIMGKKGLGQFDQHRRKTAVESKQLTPWPVALVICPSSVVENWSREFDMWGWFEWKVMDLKNCREVLTDFDNGRLDVIIATHDFVTGHIEDLNRRPFGCIVVDEVHRVKNADAARTKAYKSFACQIRFGLTGTAVQNDFSELHTVLDWSNPGRVGNKRQWDRTINMPLQRLLDKDQTDESTHDEHLLRMAFIQRLLPKFYLRRDKRIIADQMPAKRDYLVFCSLTEEQVIVYNRLLHFYNVENARVAKNDCGCGRRDPETGARLKVGKCCWPIQKNRRLLMWITILKQASDHLALLYFDPEDNKPHDPVKYAKFMKQREICKVMYPNNWQDKRSIVKQGLRSELCGKWLVLQNLLREWKANGDKQNLRLLDWLEMLVEFSGFNHRRLDGTTPQGLRQSFVDDFNYSEEITVFLISTMAGGVGLNLTSANKVVIFDPHWNPAVDQQAQDRAYRIGQTRDVDVYRLVGSGSLEERIFRRQIHKQQLANLAYGDEKQDRIFAGMHGVHNQEGDLWGLHNLFTFEPRKVPASGLIEAVDLEEAEAFAEEIEQVIQAPKVKKAPAMTDSGEVKGKGRGRGKGRGKAKASSGDEAEPDTPLDPMAAFIVQDQVLAKGDSSATEDEDEPNIEERLLSKKAKHELHQAGTGARSLRHDQIISSANTRDAKQKLRRLDDVPTIEHHGETIIVGRPRPQTSAAVGIKASKKGAGGGDGDSISVASALAAATTLASTSCGRDRSAALAAAAAAAQVAGGASQQTGGGGSSDTQTQTQTQTQVDPRQSQSQSQSQFTLSQSQTVKTRWQAPVPPSRGGSGAARKYRMPRF
ncbi:hypothetical protein OC844_002642 [Tilletia horrida]|nr:hypothetical protein OC844_002642 [Tilletia horrida]